MPSLVYTSTKTLLTLSEEQYISGMGEIIKHGLIKNREYYQWIQKHAEQIKKRDSQTCLEMILESDKIKRDVVEKDPMEKGERALLNFGHTLGHAVEKLMDFQMLHGQWPLDVLEPLGCQQRGIFFPNKKQKTSVKPFRPLVCLST